MDDCWIPECPDAKVRANSEIALLVHFFNMACAWGLTGRKNRAKASERRLIREITERNVHHPSKYLLISKHGKRMTKGMLRLRWDKAREKAQQKAIKDGDPMLAAKIGGFLFRDIRPKAGSEIVDIGGARLLLGHTKQEITKRVYRRVGVTAEP